MSKAILFPSINTKYRFDAVSTILLPSRSQLPISQQLLATIHINFITTETTIFLCSLKIDKVKAARSLFFNQV